MPAGFFPGLYGYPIIRQLPAGYAMRQGYCFGLLMALAIFLAGCTVANQASVRISGDYTVQVIAAEKK